MTSTDRRNFPAAFAWQRALPRGRDRQQQQQGKWPLSDVEVDEAGEVNTPFSDDAMKTKSEH